MAEKDIRDQLIDNVSQEILGDGGWSARQPETPPPSLRFPDLDRC